MPGAGRSDTVHPTAQLGLRIGRPEGRGWVDRLVELARSGDLAAFEAVAERSMPEVYRIAAAMVGPDDARDVTQEALLAAWRELPRLRHAGRFEPWLRSIVMNRARNALRTRRRRPTVTLIEDHRRSPAYEPMRASQDRIDLEAAFRGLSTQQREVVVLHYVVDLPLREVADTLNIPEGTAKSRLHAGLRALRTQLPPADR